MAVSVAPQAYVVEKVAGDLVRVTVTLPPGVEAHAYEPSFKVLSSVSDASLYVKVGHPHFAFEQAWLGELLRERPELRVVDSTRGIDDTSDDPHVWVAPMHVRTMAQNVAAALADLLPDKRAEIDGRLASFEREIDALEAKIRATLANRRGDRFFVFHPAWSYFAAQFGLMQVAIEKEGREPDPKALSALLAEARSAGVKVIFTQPQQSSASAQLIATEVGARIESIDPLARDWAANLEAVAAKIADGVVQ